MEFENVFVDPPCGYAFPAASLPDDKAPLSDDIIRSWRDQGFALVDGLFPKGLVERCETDALQLIPSNDSGIFGTGGIMEFPTKCSSLDELAIYPRLVTAAGQMLGSDRVIMTQSHVWRKDGQAEADLKKGVKLRGNQRMHMDYPNHTLGHPPPWNSPDLVAMIIYLSDSSECGGQTRAVPRQGDDDEAYRWPYVDQIGVGGLFPWENERPDVEKIIKDQSEETYEFRQKLYAREVAASFSRGTVLFYRHDLWHRGFPVKPGKARIAMNAIFRLQSAWWVQHWNRGWAYDMMARDPYLERFVARLCPQQLSALGLPPPGDPYWTKEMIDGFERRYAGLGLNVTPYRIALKDNNR